MSRRLPLTLALSSAALLAACELGPKVVEQTGYRGSGLEQISDPDHVAKASAIPAPPYALPADDGGPRASATYQNLQVLGGLSTDQFNHLMASITQWVAPVDGCNHCHNPENMASDELYTKRVARQMLRMNLAINTQWASHVQQTGVTCWTCHRGNNVPQYTWTNEPAQNPQAVWGNRRGQNAPNPNIGYASLPSSVFASYLGGDPSQIRVASDNAFPTGANHATVRDAENSYGIMMHVSQALGVNCTYCHNTQSFRAWNISRAQRATAWYGIRMVRDINTQYLWPLQNTLPAARRGPTGDPFQVNCLTCHQGQSRPLGGVSMLNDYPYLRHAPGPVRPAAVPPAEQGAPEALRTPEAMQGSPGAPAQPGAARPSPATTGR